MTPTAYPLCWPEAQRRTHIYATKSACIFKGSTVHTAVQDVLTELGRMGIGRDDIVISTGIPTRLDGLPRSGVTPDEHGACVWFRRGGELRHIAVDAFDNPAGNLRAIALAIESIRRLERYGCAEAIQSAAVALLDAPQLPQVAGEGRAPWWVVLEVSESAPLEVAEAAYKALARKWHPDVEGGDRATFERLANAIEEARSR